MLRGGTNLWRLGLACLLALGVQSAGGDEPPPALLPPVPGTSAAPALGPADAQPQPPSPYSAAWPPPGQDARTFNAPRQDWAAAPEQPPVVSVAPGPAVIERPVQSTWYFRQEAFYWNERSDGRDFVNEYGPLLTLGYLRRNGFERFRFELFGGTMAYDGGAQYQDNSGNWVYEPYHQSNGTNYLGIRGEYDLLIEPASWTRVRAVVGVGTRFWIRDLHDAVTPSGVDVYGYQEDWWTFYPYIGLETKESDEPGWKFFGSVRFGLTPLTYQAASCSDNALYPRCGVTGKAELGVRFQRFWASGYIEVMTLGRIGGSGRRTPARIANADVRRAARVHLLTPTRSRASAALCSSATPSAGAFSARAAWAGRW